MSNTHCRFCEITVKGLYLNCPKCGEWLAPTKGERIAPEPYELATPKPIKSLDEIVSDVIIKAVDQYIHGNGADRQAVDTVLALITERERLARVKTRIDSYQRIMLWLEDQDDNEQLVLLAKDLSVELDELFSQLQSKDKV